MKIAVPNPVKKEIEMALAGKKIVKRCQVQKQSGMSDVDLLSAAIKSFDLISNIANTELLRTFIVQKDAKIFIILAIGTFLEFSEHDSNGSLILRRLEEGVGIYYWHDANYPADRSERDYQLLSEKEIETWHRSNLEILAKLDEKKIWATIKRVVHAYRKHQ